MAIEIERKFLVRDAGWREAVSRSTRMVQGYLVAEPGLTLRVRIAGEQAFLTLKGASRGIARAEYEYPVPVADAEAMLRDLACTALVEKVRHLVTVAGRVWEVDEFAGANAGLVLAELELEDERAVFVRPDWLGEEVSDDPRYFNARLARHPYRDW
ncbi:MULTISPECIES: CYTH domain-containing protein [Marichromatium]|uniref:Adenylate cyclase n=1 Tax=Marichromatium gracile TaxID=1048 RepID=A0A4V6P4Q7_MARGR|nr:MULTISPECIES: CYTH domain-containing protein [Marichromatium]MBO8085445.1 CYTH domain-containing protein [Marichromatium sp.]MBK1708789.1 adenylate cyclase [Marichromatium gracile]RNE88994.1 CYTH domain-containing protein [Marichromatium sp. AB31]RNE93068.1 CYTH domain-containing protein [Marichromatium sp. AB32]TCW35470.1 adenylate cyclase [Marichromatium gracile]